MATIKTSITPAGYQALLRNGKEAFQFYRLLDNTHNYLTSGPENLIFDVTGSHSEITMAKTDFAGYRGLFLNTPSQREITNAINRVQYGFKRTDCSDPWDEANVNLRINIHSWFNQLLASTYSASMTESLSLNLIDNTYAEIQQLNTSTGVYSTSQVIDNFTAIAWKTVTSLDETNLNLINPRFVQIKGSGRYDMTDTRGGKFPSPFLLSFSTSLVNGFAIPGTGVKFSFMPDFGYWVNNTTFASIQDVETDPTMFDSFKPAARIGNDVYVLNTSTPYPSTYGLIGFAKQSFYKNDGSGETLLQGLIKAGKLFFMANGNYDSISQTYSLVINLNIIPTHPEINFISNKFAGNVTFNFVYNANDTTTTNNIIEII